MKSTRHSTGTVVPIYLNEKHELIGVDSSEWTDLNPSDRLKMDLKLVLNIF